MVSIFNTLSEYEFDDEMYVYPRGKKAVLPTGVYVETVPFNGWREWLYEEAVQLGEPLPVKIIGSYRDAYLFLIEKKNPMTDHIVWKVRKSEVPDA